MTKKNFVALADMIRENRKWFTPIEISLLADYCQAQNPRFKRERWLGYIDGTNGQNGGCHPCMH